MLFGSTSFSQIPFADVGGIPNVVVTPTGIRINVNTGTVSVKDQVVGPSGFRFNLATNPVSVITWNGIVPGVSQIWIPIDPEE